MSKATLLILVLCLSSLTFGQQKRANYVSYETDAGPQDLIQVAINVRLNAYLLDDDNFRKYASGVDARQIRPGVALSTATNPTYIVPPTKQHWHLVLDNAGRPLAGNASVKLFSLIKDLPQKQPE